MCGGRPAPAPLPQFFAVNLLWSTSLFYRHIVKIAGIIPYCTQSESAVNQRIGICDRIDQRIVDVESDFISGDGHYNTAVLRYLHDPAGIAAFKGAVDTVLILAIW